MKGHQFLKSCIVTVAIGLTALVGQSSKAEILYAVDLNNNLISFDSAAPGTVFPTSFYLGTEEIRGLDYWNGALYGLGAANHLYKIDPAASSTTLVGTFSPGLVGTFFGTDNGTAGFQVVSDAGQSLLLNRSTAAATVEPSLAYVTGDRFFGIAPKVTALAFNPLTGKWFAGDYLQNTLATFDPATGLLSTIGASGIDFARANGFDISLSGIGYLASPAASSDPAANLYTVNLATGQVNLVGLIGNVGDNILIRGLTAVPEPASGVLMLLGAFGLWLANRRR